MSATVLIVGDEPRVTEILRDLLDSADIGYPWPIPQSELLPCWMTAPGRSISC
jgi:hypothetical protein